MRKLVSAAVLSLGLVLTGCGTSGPVTVVEKEHELAGWHAGDKKCTKWKAGKCVKHKTTPPQYQDECFEIDWSDGREECVTEEQFNALQVGSVRA